MIRVSNEKELGKALKNNEDTIFIEGDLVNKVIRIRATGKIAWAIAVTAIALAIVAFLAAPVTGGTSSTAIVGIAPVAASILGGAAAYSAVLIGVAAGGVAALNKLRDYKEISRSDSQIVLKKK